MHFLVLDLDKSALKILLSQRHQDGIVSYVKCTLTEDQKKTLEEKGLKLNYVNFHLCPNYYIDYHREAIEFADRFTNAFIAKFPQFFEFFNAPKDAVTSALGKRVLCLTSPLTKLVKLAQYLEESSLAKPTLLLPSHSSIHPDLIPYHVLQTPATLSEKLKPLLVIMYLVLITVFASGRRGGKEKASGKLLFDQSYSYANCEIKALYSHLKTRNDVLYLCHDKNNDFYDLLSKDAKPTVFHRPGVSGLLKKAKVLKELIRLYFSFLGTRLNHTFREELLKIKYKEIYYLSLFQNLKPRMFFKVRSDMDAYHPVATWAIGTHGGVNAGYMHGAYFPFSSVFARNDFHVYGLLGDEFLNKIYRDFWPAGRKYFLLGTIGNNTRTLPVTADKFKTAVITTSACDDIWMSKKFLHDFIDACFYAHSGDNSPILVRCKTDGDDTGKILENYSQKYQVKWTSNLDSEIETNRSNTAIEEILDNCEVAVVMESSTCGWNALAMKKRFVIFQGDVVKHPFEALAPWLVVHNKEDLKDRIIALRKMPVEDFEKITAPLIERWGAYENEARFNEFLSYS